MSAVATSMNRKMLLTTGVVIAVGVAAYGLGRIYPPLGPSSGTVAPSQRYVSSQVGDADVALGDTSVAELMQTDAFQVLVKDPNFRKLANDPGFAALANNRAAMAAIAGNPGQFAALARIRRRFHNLVQQASALSAASQANAAAYTSALGVMAQNSAAFAQLSKNDGAFAAMAGRSEGLCGAVRPFGGLCRDGAERTCLLQVQLEPRGVQGCGAEGQRPGDGDQPVGVPEAGE